MKQQDIATLIIIIAIAGVASFFLSSKLVNPGDEKRTAYSVGSITPEFNVPPDDVFNESAINPTVRIKIGPNDNENPFSDNQQ